MRRARTFTLRNGDFGLGFGGDDEELKIQSFSRGEVSLAFLSRGDDHWRFCIYHLLFFIWRRVGDEKYKHLDLPDYVHLV